MRLAALCLCTATLLLAGCGGGEEEDPITLPVQTFRNCRYEFVPAGLTPALYTYRCWIVGTCDNTEPCTAAVRVSHPECEAGKTTCTACPPGSLVC